MNDGSGFEAFRLWNALKLHFTSDSYDYVKYNGKTNVSQQSFMINKSKFAFYRLSRKYNSEELKEFFIANFLAEDVKWIGDITGPDGEQNYKDWQKRNQSLTYVFENDIIYLLDKYVIKGEELFRVDNGIYPKLLQELMRKTIAIETVVIMNDLTGFMKHWKQCIQDDIVWPNWELKLRKYTPFVSYQKDKFKQILKEKVKEYAEA